MRRKLKGRLDNLGLAALFRLLGATGASGRLVVETAGGSFSLEIRGGRVQRPDVVLVREVGRCLDETSGSFNFDPQPSTGTLENGVSIGTFLDLCRRRVAPEKRHFASDVDVENLLTHELMVEKDTGKTKIHLLPTAAPENPLEDLVSELEDAAPEELLFAQVGVVTTDPRLWRGWIEREWRHRGWELKSLGMALEVPLGELDALVVHHHLAVTRVGREEDWLELLRRASGSRRSVPVIWIGPLGDPVWVARLVEAGASFLLPAPAGEGGEVWKRLQETVTRVVARLVRWGGRRGDGDGQPGSIELVEALVRGSGPGEKVGVLLQMASGALRSGAVFSVEETSIRCRAGFGFPLNAEATVLPRGIAFLEKVIRSEEALASVDADAAGARQLARVLGVERLPSGLVVIPLQGRGETAGLLVGERKDVPTEELEELVLIARRIGGAFLGS